MQAYSPSCNSNPLLNISKDSPLFILISKVDIDNILPFEIFVIFWLSSVSSCNTGNSSTP